MGYSSGLLRYRITVQNRTAAAMGKYGLDSTGATMTDTCTIWAEVTWAKGKAAMNVGALDAYGVIMVRTRWTDKINERSRIIFEGRKYQVLPDTFHADYQENTIQLHAQMINEE